MKTVYIARHGEAEVNAAGLLAGSRSESPLTDKGKQQAQQLGQQLHNAQIELVVCSPMSRTRQTAEIAAKAFGYEGTIVEQPLFIERDFGTATNVHKPEAFEMLDSGKAEGVEPAMTLHKRMLDALDWLREQPASVILVVSHGGPTDMIRTIHSGGDPEVFHRIHTLENGEVYRFTLE